MPAPASGELELTGLASSDPAAAVGFYGDVLGWQARTGANGAVTLMGDGEANLAVVYSQTAKARAAGVLPHWTPFIAVADADAAQASAVALGASTLREPFDAAGMGRIAPIRDPVGATVSLWEPSPSAESLRAGARRGHCWHELRADDVVRARRFYSALFGWTVRSGHDGPATITASGRVIAAIRSLGALESGDAGWIPCFSVNDVERSARTAQRLGARCAADGPARVRVRDPQGAVFALLGETTSREAPGR